MGGSPEAQMRTRAIVELSSHAHGFGTLPLTSLELMATRLVGLPLCLLLQAPVGLAIEFAMSLVSQWRQPLLKSPCLILLLPLNTWQQVVSADWRREAVRNLLHVQPEFAHPASCSGHLQQQLLPGC